MKIAVFDSGIGGLTVVKSMVESSFFEEIIYYGDTARVPYGTKDSNTIIRYTLEALEFFENFEVDMMVVACNSATAYALEELKKYASFPVYGVIESGVLAIENRTKDKNSTVLVIGTSATINSKAYNKQLNNLGFKNITNIPTPLLVPLIEEEIEKDNILIPIFDHYFSNVKNPDYIILGCTHFPLIKNKIQNYFRNSILIHSGDAIVEYLQNRHKLEKKFDKNEKRLKLFASENGHKLKRIAKKWIFNEI